MAIDQPVLSKSRFQSGKQCELKLWQEIHARNRATPYGESQEAVFDRIPPARRGVAAIQIAEEIAFRESSLKVSAQAAAAKATKQATDLRRQLGEVEAFRRKLKDKRDKHQKKIRRSMSKKKSKSRNKKR